MALRYPGGRMTYFSGVKQASLYFCDAVLLAFSEPKSKSKTGLMLQTSVNILKLLSGQTTACDQASATA